MESRRLIAHNIRRIRLTKRLSQEDLALEANVDRTYVGGLERAARNPSVDILDKLAGALEVKTAEFFSDIEDVEMPPGLPRGRRRKSL